MNDKRQQSISLWDFFLEKAKARKRKIGIGIAKVTPRIVKSLHKVRNVADLVVVGKKIENFECIESDNIEYLLEMVKKKEEKWGRKWK